MISFLRWLCMSLSFLLVLSQQKVVLITLQEGRQEVWYNSMVHWKLLPFSFSSFLEKQEAQRSLSSATGNKLQ